MIDTFFTDIEPGKIFPLDKIAEVYKGHESPKIARYFDRGIKDIDLEAYNTVILNKAHLNGDKEKLKEIFSRKDIDKVINDLTLDKKLGVDIPQAIYLDSNYKREAILLHLAKIKDDEVFLDDILLANIFADRQKFEPLPGQTYPGMGNKVFDTVLSNLYSTLKNKGINYLSCHASQVEQGKIFERRGFKLDMRDMSLVNMAMLTESQFPLVREI